ncbi:MAG: DUF4149 domain-containing protein [Chloroflexi bacterium]|nr:DUF4149 domain-containing protein [Chloroflexota bacterium]
MHSVGENINQLFFLTALAVWTGGIFVVAIVAPIIFRVAQSRDQAGAIVAAALEQFDRLRLIGTAVLLATSVVHYAKWVDQVNGTLATRYALLAGMVFFAAAVRFVVTPRLQRLNREIGSFDREGRTVNRQRFNDLHRWNSTLTTFELLCGLAVFYTL